MALGTHLAVIMRHSSAVLPSVLLFHQMAVAALKAARITTFKM
jgi:hypothetical protein